MFLTRRPELPRVRGEPVAPLGGGRKCGIMPLFGGL
jgi:hypothetical protein